MKQTEEELKMSIEKLKLLIMIINILRSEILTKNKTKNNSGSHQRLLFTTDLEN